VDFARIVRAVEPLQSALPPGAAATAFRSARYLPEHLTLPQPFTFCKDTAFMQ